MKNKKINEKFALITFGNDESYGLSFVGGELLEHGQEIKFFDGEANWLDIVSWQPDFLMFSPMTTYYPQALELAIALKKSRLKATTVFGGHHAMARPDIVIGRTIDVVVVGPVRGSIPQILNGARGIIQTNPTDPSDLASPARAQYFKDIPRIAKRYRKFVLSMLGCPWNCSYCSSSSGHIRDLFGRDAHRDYYMARRPIEDVIAEVAEIRTFDTKEIEWVDDDIFAGDEEWLLEFIDQWCANFTDTIVDGYGVQDVVMPMYVSATSHSILKASDKLLESLRRCVNVVGMGVQAIRPETLKLCNRSWDNEAKMKKAYDRLVSQGYRVNLQGIVGFPVDDPLEDAIETVMGMQRIGKGSICSLYPLMVYPGTQMEELCKDRPKNEKSVGDTNTGVCDLAFPVQKQLKNLCKLATFIVKYGLDESLARILINADYDEVSEDLSMQRYRECVVDRLGGMGEGIFDDIVKNMRLKF